MSDPVPQGFLETIVNVGWGGKLQGQINFSFSMSAVTFPLFQIKLFGTLYNLFTSTIEIGDLVHTLSRTASGPSGDFVNAGSISLSLDVSKSFVAHPPAPLKVQAYTPAAANTNFTGTIYWVYNFVTQGSLANAKNHPFTTGDPFTIYPLDDPRSNCTIPLAFNNSAAQANYIAALGPAYAGDSESLVNSLDSRLVWHTSGGIIGGSGGVLSSVQAHTPASVPAKTLQYTFNRDKTASVAQIA